MREKEGGGTRERAEHPVHPQCVSEFRAEAQHERRHTHTHTEQSAPE